MGRFCIAFNKYNKFEIILRPLTRMGRFCLWGRLARAQHTDAAHESPIFFPYLHFYFFRISNEILLNSAQGDDVAGKWHIYKYVSVMFPRNDSKEDLQYSLMVTATEMLFPSHADKA